MLKEEAKVIRTYELTTKIGIHNIKYMQFNSQVNVKEVKNDEGKTEISKLSDQELLLYEINKIKILCERLGLSTAHFRIEGVAVCEGRTLQYASSRCKLLFNFFK